MNENLFLSLQQLVPVLTKAYPEIGTVLWVGSSVRKPVFHDVDLALIVAPGKQAEALKMVLENHPDDLPLVLEESFRQTGFRYWSEGGQLPLDLIIQEADVITNQCSSFWNGIFGLPHQVLVDDGVTYAACRAHCQSDLTTQLIGVMPSMFRWVIGGD